MIGRLLLLLVGWMMTFSGYGAMFVPPSESWRYFKGFSEASTPDRTTWRNLDFNDSGWLTGRAAFYYENNPGEATAFTGNTVLSDMDGGYTCVFLRRTFMVTNVNDLLDLQIVAFSDDGFLAWLNGHLIAQFNMPAAEVAYSRSSNDALAEPLSWWTNSVADFRSFLVVGTNVLAVQAFNSSIGSSSDFVINPALYYTPDTFAPTLTLRYPPPDELVRQLSTIEVGFSEPVSGVDAGDLRINGQPATNLTVITSSQYLFTFPPPPTGMVQVAWATGHGIRDLTSRSNTFVGVSWSYYLNPNAPLPGAMISEFLTANSGDQANSVHDELGGSPDWIELYNSSSTAISLTGWALTDNASKLMKWRFPAAVLPANGYLLVMASGRDTNVNGQLHTNFKLSSSPSFLALVDANTNVVSSFAPTYPQQYSDVSYGRDRLEPSSLLGYYTNTTPRAANATRGVGFGPEIQFARASGTFFNGFSLTLSTTDTNWDIRYILVSTNLAYGTAAVTNVPVTTSPLYAGPIAITDTTQVRARAFPRKVGYWPGPPRTENYIRLAPSVASFSSDLPVILLHNLAGGTLSASMPAEDQSVVIMTFEPVNGRTSLTNPPTLVTRGGFNIRGSSTAWTAQYPLALETWDEYNQDREVEFLGLPAESDWVLFSQNGYDPSYLHNPLAHQLSRDIGRYSSRTRFAEVFLNTGGGEVTFTAPASGNYFGLYTIEEKVKRDNNRVNIPALEPQETNAAAITGGYLLKIDRADGDERTFRDPYLQGDIVFQDPPGLEMEATARQAQRNYITGYFSQFGAALWGSSYTNPVTGYAAYIDVDSWVDHHILNVLTFNVDALRLSGYFYKDRGKKIEMGPLWDFDRSLGSPDGRPFNPRLWRVQQSGDQGTDFFGNPNLLGVRWWQRLFTDPDFWQRWIDRWTDLRRDAFTTNRLNAWVDTLGNQARQAQTRHVQRWGDSNPRNGTANVNGYSHFFPGTYQGELIFLKRWLSDRVNFIDTNFLRAPVFSASGGAITQGFQLTIAAPTLEANSTTYCTRDGTDPRLPGGAINPRALSNRGTILLTLTNNARVFARNFNLAHINVTGGEIGGNPPISSPWSGSTIATFVVATPPLAITEIMYHPAPPASGTNTGGDFEFIELKNAGAQNLNLIGMRFTNGLDFTFASTNAITNLGPGQYCVLVRNRAAFLSRYPAVTNIAGQYTNSLDNAGERIALEGALREPILDFKFNDAWHPTTDGAGFSLVIRNENAAFNTWTNPASWRASSALGGSPGRADAAPSNIPSIIVNEALTHTDPPELDTIELFNPTASTANVSGWFLTDDPAEPLKFRIPTNTVIPASGYVTFTEAQLSTNETGFALGSLGDQIYLHSGDGTNLTGYRHGFEFGPQVNGITFGRHISSDGKEHFVTEAAKTLGLPNAGPEVGPIVINELMFAPPPFGASPDTWDEYVELRNVTGLSAPLFDPLHPTNTWRLDGGVQFTFPPGTTLPPWSYLLVVNFDPDHDPVLLAWFRTRYGLDAAAPIFGPYNGNLANEGERIGLYLPDKPEIAPSPVAGFVPYVLVEEVDYSSQSPWPSGATESGNSFQRVASVAFANDPANWRAEAPTPGGLNDHADEADTDLDSLPDEWELANGLDPKTAGLDNGPDGDPDQDGATNAHEFVAGTDPQDAGDCLRLEALPAGASVNSIQFATRHDRLYTVEASTNLNALGAWTQVGSTVEGNGQPATLHAPVSAAPVFYRLSVRRE